MQLNTVDSFYFLILAIFGVRMNYANFLFCEIVLPNDFFFCMHSYGPETLNYFCTDHAISVMCLQFLYDTVCLMCQKKGI